MPVSNAFAAVLLQRMRCLSRVERGVLMRASVIGRRFTVFLLAGASGVAEALVVAALEKACAMQLVVRESETSDWYAFRHALVRDIAYAEYVATLLRRTHRLIARAIEGAPAAEASLNDLAYHSWAARDAGRCTKYNEMAGDRAAAAFATREACMYYDRAREFAGAGSARHRRLTHKISVLKNE